MSRVIKTAANVIIPATILTTRCPEEARATVESEIESMLNGKEDVDTAVKNMADSINKSIEEYNLVNE